MLGSMLAFYCHKHGIPYVSVSRSKYDVIKDPVEKLSTVLPGDTTVVVNCIGAIPQRKYSEAEYRSLNETFPHQLADYCERRSVALVHVSTNCVFSGKRANCVETDEADAEDLYGISKLKGEPKNATVFRCSIIGFEPASSNGLLEWFYKNTAETVYGYTDSFWNGLTTYELSRRIVACIEANDLPRTVRHFNAANTLSKYQILCYIGEKYKPCIRILSKEAGLRHYTLASSAGMCCSDTLEKQIDELFSIERSYREFIGR